MLEPLRNYCERTADTLWSEPLNAVSNIAFFIAAWALYQLYIKLPLPLREGIRGGVASSYTDSKDTPHPNPPPQGGRENILLIALVAVVGAGSTLFHTFANGLTMLFDVIPIAAFTFYYLWVALRKMVGLSKLKTAAALTLFAIIASQMPHIPAGYRFNGSVDYFPCLGALLMIGFILKARRHPSARWILKAAACFVVSLTFRSVDFMVCEYIPIGTHFIWHTLNGLMLYLLVRAIFENRKSAH